MDTKYSFQGVEFLGFESVTVAPIQTKLVDLGIMSEQEIKWLNDYNQRCFREVGALMDPNEGAYKWLQKETMPVVSMSN